MDKAIINRRSRLALLVAAAGSLAVACGDNRSQSQSTTMNDDRAMEQESTQTTDDRTTFADVKAEASDLTAAISDYSADQRREFSRDVDQALASVDKRIETIEMRAKSDWEELSDTAKQKSQAMLDDLREKREAVADSYNRIENDTDAAWDEIKSGFSEAWNEVVAAVENAEQEFNSDG